jgi:hypothetical protein
MTIIGLHTIIYAKQPDEVRAFLRDVLALPSVDAGRGWLIFKSPPAEIAVHPTEDAPIHELYLMCEGLDATMADLERKHVNCSVPAERPWGRLTTIHLPGGDELGLYQPRHPMALGLG